ncbi:hypothetical protein ACFYZJ_38860 [Streptomyces sp. NPDC001848]
MQERMEAYLAGPAFRAGMEGFGIGRIVEVAEPVPTSTADSPLR